jgi:hypothetical protein
LQDGGRRGREESLGNDTNKSACAREKREERGESTLTLPGCSSKSCRALWSQSNGALAAGADPRIPRSSAKQQEPGIALKFPTGKLQLAQALFVHSRVAVLPFLRVLLCGFAKGGSVDSAIKTDVCKPLLRPQMARMKPSNENGRQQAEDPHLGKGGRTLPTRQKIQEPDGRNSSCTALL